VVAVVITMRKLKSAQMPAYRNFLSMKEFSHPGSEEKTLTDINRAIESTVTVARNV
jgi:hypothetical protein